MQVETSHGRIAVQDTGGDGPPVLLIHGNSSCKEVFRAQFAGALAKGRRLVAFDLPGHGASADATDPARSYRIPGYADLVMELADRLGLPRAAVIGWSLGGHVALELVARWPGIVGALIVGTPPIRFEPQAVAAAFHMDEHAGLTGQETFSDADALTYAGRTTGRTPPEDFLLRAVRRCDGRSRAMMFASALAGEGEDEAALVAQSPVPLAVLTGGAEPIVRNDYILGLRYAALWRNAVQALPGLGHAPFYEDPATFDAVAGAFLGSLPRWG
ncbi:alpha/beta fold hydrolase [Zavarzinia sp. CC-PAN008]|uniref:alpha/beta fold hydrolase n=1 Tax=Zavarzinia sp. CC-PAN008 TaxID=3243332 RepID=UPI003F7487B4